MAGLKPLIDQLDGRLDRDAILQAHARQESTQQRTTPSMLYSDLLATVYRNLADEWALSVIADEAAIYGASVEHWPAFADSVDALAYLKQHFKLVILSNVEAEARRRIRQVAALVQLADDLPTGDAISLPADVGRRPPVAAMQVTS